MCGGHLAQTGNVIACKLHFTNISIDLAPSSLQLVDTTVELANKVGAAEIIGRVVEDLKDDNEQYRKMVMETIELVSCVLCTVSEASEAGLI